MSGSEHTQRQPVERRPSRRFSRTGRAPDYVLALDFGYSHDFTTSVLLQRVECELDQTANEDNTQQHRVQYHVKHLKRFPLRTEVPTIISFVIKQMLLPGLKERTGLIVDATGGGIPITQEMRRNGLKPIGMTITAGSRPNGDNVPKQHLLSRLLLRVLRVPLSCCHWNLTL